MEATMVRPPDARLRSVCTCGHGVCVERSCDRCVMHCADSEGVGAAQEAKRKRDACGEVNLTEKEIESRPKAAGHSGSQRVTHRAKHREKAREQERCRSRGRGTEGKSGRVSLPQQSAAAIEKNGYNATQSSAPA